MLRIAIAVVIAPTLSTSLACRPAGRSRVPSGTVVRSQPDSTMEWMGRGGGFGDWGCGGKYLYARSVNPVILDVWQWEGEVLTKLFEVNRDGEYSLSWIDGDLIIFSGLDGYKPFMGLRNARSGKLLRRWDPPVGYYCDHFDLNRNGEFVALCLTEEVGEGGPPDRDGWRTRLKVGLFSVCSKDLKWIATLTGVTNQVEHAAVSDDGAYIAVAGWENSLVLIDVATQKVLWTFKPAGPQYHVAFSPDGETVYSGGTLGMIHSIEVETGRLLDSWATTRSGRDEYLHRLSCLAASGDGRWVAAGAGLEGKAYLFDTRTGKLAQILAHGGGAVRLLSFSPDSKVLATFVPGSLKVWKMPQ